MNRKENDPWLGPIAGWLPLSRLLEYAQVELGVLPAVAAKTLRVAIEQDQLNGQVHGWNGVRSDRDGMQNWTTGLGDLVTPGEYPLVTVDGWKHVDFKSGTLDGCEIFVLWDDVKRTLAAHASTSSVRYRPRAVGGAPQKHDWDAFWIAIVHYAALNDLDPEHRVDLQRYMMDWTSRNSNDPPDDATIRARLAKLYKTPETSSN